MVKTQINKKKLNTMGKFLNKIEMLNENERPYSFTEFRNEIQNLNEENIELDDTTDQAPLFSEKDIQQIKHEVYGMLKGRNDTGLLYNVKRYTFEPPEGLPTMVTVVTNNIADYELDIDEFDNNPIPDEGMSKEKVSNWDIVLKFVDKRPESDEEFDKEMDYLSMKPERLVTAKSDRDVDTKSIGREKVEQRAKAEPYQPKGPYLLWFDIEVEPTKIEKRKDRLAKKEEEASTEEEERRISAKKVKEEEKLATRLDKEAEVAAIAAAKGKKSKNDYDPEFGF